MSNVRRWRLFGITLATDFPFASRLLVGSGEPDLVFECGSPPALEQGLETATELYVSPQRVEGGEPLCVLYQVAACDVLRFAGIADFYITSNRILGHLVDAVDLRLVEIRFLGSVLSYWLERRGILALHASAVVVDGQAIAFMSGNLSGKTGLAATLVRQGHPLLTDDILPIEEREDGFWGYPGYPQMRMWPDLVTHFLGDYDDLDVVHPAVDKRRVKLEPETFCERNSPMARLYLPERRPVGEQPRCEVLPVSPRDALIEFVRHSFSPFLVEAVGLQPQRLDKIGRLLGRAPARRVLYPEGFDNLEKAASVILEDVSTSA